MKKWMSRLSGIALVATGLLPASTPALTGEHVCQSSPEDQAVIRALIEDGRLGHEKEDPALTAAAYADQATSINRGKVSTITRESVEEKFVAYFSAVDILESRFLSDPEITILPGGCSAWSTVTMLVRYSYANRKGEKQTARYEFAWLSIWKKSADGAWRRTVMVSTDDGGTAEGQ